MDYWVKHDPTLAGKIKDTWGQRPAEPTNNSEGELGCLVEWNKLQ